jgi:hypothetical protein
MNWFKQSKAFLTKLEYNKLIYAIMDVATSQFTEMMRKAGGDPLPTTEAVIDNPQDYGSRMGLSPENVAEILERNPQIQYSNGSVIVGWQDLPQKNKQQARQRSGTLKYELV